jgi:hypothetical protein
VILEVFPVRLEVHAPERGPGTPPRYRMPQRGNVRGAWPMRPLAW